MTDFFDFALANARLVHGGEPMQHVSVECRIGTATYARCTADRFSGDVLTITAVDDERVIDEIPAGQWVRATVYDDMGHSCFTIEAKTQALPLLSHDGMRELVAAGDPRRI